MSKLNKKELHELFNSLKNKNQNAYNILYEKYYSLVYGIVFSIIKNKADAEDITHEIFTKIYRLDVNKLPSENEASWLYTVCKNECFLFIRKSKPNISIDEIFEMPNNSNEIDIIVDREYYNKLISGLKEDEKMIVSLKVLSNFTFKKISQIMNIPIGTVQWKYYNAINSLKISIGSLVGAVMAFIIVCANGDFWKKKNYANRAHDNEREEKGNTTENTETNNQSDKANEAPSEEKKESQPENSSIVTNEEKSNNEISNIIDNQENSQENINKESKENTNTESTKEITSVDVSNSEKYSKINGFQAVFSVIGIVLFITFLIFFKIYQQKLRKKSSK